mmetsp:Transcript_64443/g.178608  ORF Transcript_64443/g.178608 Transcript_64443/m.178608 type:complete len:240 (+) Transcript_64443:282-1001(+)
MPRPWCLQTAVTAWVPATTRVYGRQQGVLGAKKQWRNLPWDDEISDIASKYLQAKYRGCDSDGTNCRALCDKDEIKDLMIEILPPVSTAELDKEVETVMGAFADDEFIDIEKFVEVVAGNTYWMEAGELVVKELMYLDCLQSSYVEKKALLENDDYDELKDSLTWDGSALPTMSGKEAKFLYAVATSRKGLDRMDDKEYAALKTDLKQENSWVVQRTQDPLEKLGMNTLMGYVHRSMAR